MSFIIEDALTREGFEVKTARNGEDGLQKHDEFNPDIVVADVMMPKMDGFEMVKLIRLKAPQTPVIFLTARTALDDLLHGFEIGANDYLRKPFQLAELIARIKALLNRRTGQQEDTVITIDECTLNFATQKLTTKEETRELTHTEAVILNELFHHQNEIVEARTLMYRIWQNDNYNNLNRLHGFIYKLRKYIRSTSLDILNIRGIGYKLTNRT